MTNINLGSCYSSIDPNIISSYVVEHGMLAHEITFFDNNPQPVQMVNVKQKNNCVFFNCLKPVCVILHLLYLSNAVNACRSQPNPTLIIFK